MKQKDIIKKLKSVDPCLKISQPVVSRIQNGKEQIPYPLAFVLASIFPWKTAKEWKNATAKDFNKAFDRGWNET